MRTRKLVYAIDPVDGSYQSGPYRSEKSDANDLDIMVMHPSGTIGFTSEGGLAVKLTNKTGAATIKGMAVVADTTTNCAFKKPVDSYDMIGYIYNSGVADGSEAWIVTSGMTYALIDGACTREDWLKVGVPISSGRLTASFGPTGLGAMTTDEHFKECGHCLETKSSGSAQLVKIMVHFN